MTIDPRVQAVTFALADPGNGLPDFHRMRVLGLDMRPFAEIAVEALDKWESEQIITTTLDVEAIGYISRPGRKT